MRTLRLAVQFLTILPFRVPGGVSAAELRLSLAWFPVVGLLLGGGLAALELYALRPDRLSCLLLVLAGVLVTGALHLDGLADMADGLCARKDREGRLAVLRDPRVGAAGAAAVAGALLLRLELLACLPPRVLLLALLSVPAMGRAAMVAALRMPPARQDGLASLWGPAPGGAVLVALAFLAGLPLLCLGPSGGLKALAAVLGAAAVVLWAAHRAFGGVTGDVCGAVGESVELAALAGFVAWGGAA